MSNKLSSVFQKVKESFIPKGTCHFPPSPTEIEHTDDERKQNRSAIQSQKALKWIQGRLLHDCLCRESSCYRVDTQNPSGTNQLWNFQIWQLNKSGRSLCGTRAASCVCQGWAAHMRGPQRWWRASAHFLTDSFFNLSPSLHPLGEEFRILEASPVKQSPSAAVRRPRTQKSLRRLVFQHTARLALLYSCSCTTTARGGDGELRWRASDVARCARQRNGNGERNTPSVLAVSPTLCALKLYRITLFTTSAGSGALLQRRHTSLQDSRKNQQIRQPLHGGLGGGSGGVGRV